MSDDDTVFVTTPSIIHIGQVTLQDLVELVAANHIIILSLLNTSIYHIFDT